MNRRVILIGAAVLLVVMIILLIKIRSTDTAAEPGRSDVATETTTTSGKVRRDRPKPATATTDTPATDDPDNKDYTETIVNGVRVRDHRKNKQPVDVPPKVERPVEKKLPSPLVYDLSSKLTAVMKDCVKGQIPKASRGTKPKLEGTIFVDIKDGNLTVTEATMQVRDVTSDTAAIKQCMEQKSVGQTVPSGTTEATTHYAITVSYAIPHLE